MEHDQNLSHLQSIKGSSYDSTFYSKLEIKGYLNVWNELELDKSVKYSI